MKLDLFIILVIVVAIGIALVNSKQGHAPITPKTTDPKILLTFINGYRKEKRLVELKESSTLCEFANIRLPEVDKDFSHKGFFPLVEKFRDRGYKLYGENLAGNNAIAMDTLTTWKNSPPHNVELTNPNYRDACIALDDKNIVLTLGEPVH